MKKTIVKFSIGVAVLLMSAFTQQDRKTLTIKVQGHESNIGQTFVYLYKEGDDITKEPYKQLSRKIVNNDAVFLFEDLPYGNYAAIAWHDQNANAILDYKLGMPSEPMGFSNNWKLSLFSGMPNFNKLKFKYSNDALEHKINM